MSNELIRYAGARNLSDLSGTFDDLGQLISYTKDLTKSLVPLADTLTDTLNNLPSKLIKFIEANPGLMLFTGFGAVLVSGALVTTIINNCIQIKNNWNR